MISKNYKQEFIQFLLRVGALQFGDFTAKSGRKIPYFINAGEIKTGMQIATLGKFYAQCYLDKIGRRQTVLYGPAYKGIPIAISTSFALSAHDLDIPFFFNRKEEKDHGEGGMFVGYLPKEKEDIVIVEDVITAGTTIRESYELVQELSHVKVNAAIIMVDRMEKGSGECSATEEISEKLGFPIHAIVTVYDIIAYLEQHPEKVDPRHVERIKEYLKDYGAPR